MGWVAWVMGRKEGEGKKGWGGSKGSEGGKGKGMGVRGRGGNKWKRKRKSWDNREGKEEERMETYDTEKENEDGQKVNRKKGRKERMEEKRGNPPLPASPCLPLSFPLPRQSRPLFLSLLHRTLFLSPSTPAWPPRRPSPPIGAGHQWK